MGYIANNLTNLFESEELSEENLITGHRDIFKGVRRRSEPE